MSAVVKNLGEGGGELKGVGKKFQGGGAGGTLFWVGRVYRRITGRQHWRLLGDVWEYPLLETAIQEVEEYVLRRKNTLV